MLAALLHGYFWHPLTGNGYQFWSGIGSDFGELTLITALALFVRNRNCHVHRCWRLSWAPHPEHGHPVCRRHHPHGQGRGAHLDPALHNHKKGTTR